MTTSTRPAFADKAIGTLDFWTATPERREAEIFAPLRATAPVSWQPPAQGTLPVVNPDEEGFWAVTGHREVIEVTQDPTTFCSRLGMMYEDFPPEAYEAMASIMAMDAPQHGRVRGLISAAFTPKRLVKIRDQIQAQAEQIVTDLLAVESGRGDFVQHVSARLPLWTISEMVGVPPEDRDAMIDAVLKINGFLDPAINEGRDPATVQQEGMLFLHAMAQQLAEQRRADPQDDLMTALVQAEIDGQHLTQMQISSFFVLLTAAGNDTTRNTTSVGMRALTLHPEQRSDLVADLDGLLPVAIEEILRWASPVLTMRRTATRDVVIADAHIRKGDKVVLFYAAANFDEKVFENPLEFDIRRSPNKHVSFGGGGPHFCLGNQLAKMQLTSLFTELLTRVPDLEVGEPVYEINTTIRSIREMPFTFTPAAHD
ncbi:cytochrome P450 [Rhodococcus pyridinivorans]|uniref:cytochrome P450 n=1 Tax=Rhodococcus pyridinivorans TaxID=103816 RepID=UPI0022266144|nr:cytochrome P450 [Rhodococcus pyridinivorans]MCW3472703.1 cytochrome P450 [Rhodococcus pyridinivorans]MCW3472707.1 cytochrome P450 [Rhodococcus pyridinivorans]